MYPQNTTSPRGLYAKVIKTTDGSGITSGVAAYHVQGTTRAAGGGTLTHIANGLWRYLPTQAEGDYTSFAVEFYHADAIAGGPVVAVVTGSLEAIADECHSRGMQHVEDAADPYSEATATMAILNAGVTGGVRTIRKSDGTPMRVQSVTSDAEATPATGVGGLT
jgi:hypothetical protein